MDADTERAIIIAIWPKLQRGRWDINHSRDLDDHGDKPNFKTACTGTVPNAARAYSQHTIHHALAAQLHTGEWVGLTHDAYQRAYLDMSSDEQRAHYASLTGKRSAPYRLTVHRGEPYIRDTEYGWTEPWARHARAAMRRVARECVLARFATRDRVHDASCAFMRNVLAST